MYVVACRGARDHANARFVPQRSYNAVNLRARDSEHGLYAFPYKRLREGFSYAHFGHD